MRTKTKIKAGWVGSIIDEDGFIHEPERWNDACAK
jgi:hypothetical protein